MNKFSNIFLVLSLALCSCAVGPDFEKPSDESMPAGFEDEQGEFKGQVGDISKWWEFFGDPLLTELVEKSLVHNFDVRSAVASLDAAYATLGVSQSGLFPTIDANASMSEQGTGKGATAPMYSAGLSAEWEIDVFGATRRGIESSLASYEYSKADLQAVRIKIAAEVADKYYLYRSKIQNLKITRQNLETQIKTYEITKKRVGFEGDLEVARAAAQVASTKAQIPTLEAEAMQARYALELLVGLPLGSLKDRLSEYRELPAFERAIPVSVPAELLQRRPDIIAAEYALKAANAKIGQAKADYYPKFYISGNISYSAPDTVNVFQNPYGSWNVGPTAKWNLFNAGKTYYNVRYQEALTRKAGVDWDSVVATAIKETQDYMAALSKERQRVESLLKAVEMNNRAYEISFKLYTAGEIEFMDLLDVQRTLLSSEQTLVESRRLVLSNIIYLYKSLGGGWNLSLEN